jgi:hypothetical protein
MYQLAIARTGAAHPATAGVGARPAIVAAASLARFPPVGLLPGAGLFAGTGVPDNIVTIAGGLLPGDLQLQRANPCCARRVLHLLRTSSPPLPACSSPRRIFCFDALAASVPRLSRPCSASLLQPSPVAGVNTPCRPNAGPCPVGPTPPPTPSSSPPKLDPSLSLLSRSDPPLSRPSRPDPSSLWLDRHLHGWIHRCRGFLDRIRRYPFYSAAGATTLTGAYAYAVAGLLGEAP